MIKINQHPSVVYKTYDREQNVLAGFLAGRELLSIATRILQRSIVRQVKKEKVGGRIVFSLRHASLPRRLISSTPTPEHRLNFIFVRDSTVPSSAAASSAIEPLALFDLRNSRQAITKPNQHIKLSHIFYKIKSNHIFRDAFRPGYSLDWAD